MAHRFFPFLPLSSITVAVVALIQMFMTFLSTVNFCCLLNSYTYYFRDLPVFIET